MIKTILSALILILRSGQAVCDYGSLGIQTPLYASQLFTSNGCSGDLVVPLMPCLYDSATCQVPDINLDL